MPTIILFLERSSAFDLDPDSAPLPLARTQYDAGRILMDRESIGEYLRVKDVHAGTLNVAAVTITLFFPAATPVQITLQGLHSLDTGHEVGSISASSLPSVVGTPFIYDGDSGNLSLLFP